MVLLYSFSASFADVRRTARPFDLCTRIHIYVELHILCLQRKAIADVVSVAILKVCFSVHVDRIQEVQYRLVLAMSTESYSVGSW